MCCYWLVCGGTKLSSGYFEGECVHNITYTAGMVSGAYISVTSMCVRSAWLCALQRTQLSSHEPEHSLAVAVVSKKGYICTHAACLAC